MRGEDVVVERPVETGRDPGNAPIVAWAAEVVGNVLVAPGAAGDAFEATRPAGTEVQWTLHFPKPYDASLRGARISVRGDDAVRVIGDPRPFALDLTPGDWWMPVQIGTTHG